ncbi:type II toxin-antitoxin system Phd/YefM family antitoxin [Oceanotoga sp. DSM 15011]|jgi:prevent-host-death family protein|uniref:Antitoxin n=1 Tax=Oceanotoga teriensis TaxID=515440 RepID=A0AA45C5Y6_9BACT|nr:MULTISPECIES: type II toxin-antitoxin system Phd/YefM family antitoxin [Oceanotoga]MDN5341486.1 antitoxin Phd [Oceanotoga sp.]MDO7977654.1 type II toxin-antitoxin system Phd/YefM family antitoxin [Oceanotoga teriensis]PWJ90057.1 prevent-host-death family protein [Oceanotoga teriensis]UYP00517.1 type II toxin-antitoxin system Phd/YefM family antitoxin [Oceanotoga sp. DSM 15011]
MNLSNYEFQSVAQAKANFSKVIESSKKGEIIITKNGKPESIIMNYEKFKNMMNFLEEIKDLSLLDASEVTNYKQIKEFFNNFED